MSKSFRAAMQRCQGGQEPLPVPTLVHKPETQFLVVPLWECLRVPLLRRFAIFERQSSKFQQRPLTVLGHVDGLSQRAAPPNKVEHKSKSVR